jgi:hypothetical protein
MYVRDWVLNGPIRLKMGPLLELSHAHGLIVDIRWRGVSLVPFNYSIYSIDIVSLGEKG